MKRPQRNLFVIMAAMAAVYSIMTRLPWQAAAALGGAALLALAGLALWGRDYLVARRRLRRREWLEAVEGFQRFERKASKGGWRWASVLLHLSIYSFDGVAIARNGVGQALIGAGQLDRAVTWLRSALQRDPQYPVPYVNLAVVAAMRRDETNARRELSRAVELGYSAADARRILHRALLEAKTDQGGRND